PEDDLAVGTRCRRASREGGGEHACCCNCDCDCDVLDHGEVLSLAGRASHTDSMTRSHGMPARSLISLTAADEAPSKRHKRSASAGNSTAPTYMTRGPAREMRVASRAALTAATSTSCRVTCAQ